MAAPDPIAEILLSGAFSRQQVEALLRMAQLLAGGVQSVQPGTGIDVDATDAANPVVGLDAATVASLALADSAVQDAPSDGVLRGRLNGAWSPIPEAITVYPKLAIVTASGNFILPATALPKVRGALRAGGGAGGGPTASSPGGGGGGGEYLPFELNLTPGTTYPVVIGAGGTGATSSAGGDGGNSTFAGLTARGGKGGSNVTPGKGGASGAGSISAASGVPEGGMLSGTSTPGGTGVSGSANPSYASVALYGECSGGGGNTGGGASSSFHGAGAGATGTGVSGGNAAVVGCGGGAGRNAAGGNGFRGQLDVEYWDTVP